jgi:leucyl aminopeptidase
MKVSVNESAPTSYDDEDIVVWGVHKGFSCSLGLCDEYVATALHDFLDAQGFFANLGEHLILYSPSFMPARRLFIIGLGDYSLFDIGAAREVAGRIAKKVRDAGLSSFAFAFSQSGFSQNRNALACSRIAQGLVEGAMLSLYRYEELKSTCSAPYVPYRITFLLQESDHAANNVSRSVRLGELIARSTCLARDLINMPANYLAPRDIAEIASHIAMCSATVTCDVLDKNDLATLGMGAFLGVSEGSAQPPALVVLQYAPHHLLTRDIPPVVLVGKGVTFDSGGISLKNAQDMDRMKGDMAGAAVILSIFQVIEELALPINIVGLMPCAENMPSGQAYKPGDVLKSMSGTTIEVINTDAEGRLILADALTYARQYSPRAIIDIATLTNSCVVALGEHMAAGVFSTDEELYRRLQDASVDAGERLWRLPLFDQYMERLRSDVADIVNSPGDSRAGVGVSATFLKHFVDGFSWAHIDIAGMFFEGRGEEKRPSWSTRGGTGFGVRLLIQLLIDWESPEISAPIKRPTIDE